MSSEQRKAPTGIIGGECLDVRWLTPPKLLAHVREYFGGPIPFDPATEPDNPTRATIFLTEKDDGLLHDWPDQVWVNPPYGKDLPLWYEKIQEVAKEGKTVVALLPCSRWETRYFQMVLAEASAVCFIRKRVKFIRASTGDAVAGNTYANMFMGWNVDAQRWHDAFSPLGCCLQLHATSTAPDAPVDHQATLFPPTLAKEFL